tara:strand:+ start:862 stop:1314 length:453 start_codon:yes stop_codon:yes gene_type:complete
MWNLKLDLLWGKNNERKVVCFLNRDIFIKDFLKLYEDEKKQVDMRNLEIVGEVKSRNNKHDKYRETFFGYNKILYLKSQKDKRIWKFYFLFTDGLYVWTYNEAQYEVRDFEHHERGWISQVYVDIKYLEKLSSTVTSCSHLPEDYKEYVN